MLKAAPLSPRPRAWGIATSAFQIEGSFPGDGRGPSIWDAFQERPGAIRNGDKALDACQHLVRWREDVALLRELGVDSYRFSLSWSRLLPEGTGETNPAGIAFYDQLVDALLEAGIQPWVTLYHWDLPLALEQRGGWRNRAIADWLADYATLVHRLYGDRLAVMLVLNEACMTSHRGHLWGTDAPGLSDETAFFQSIHHQNLAQGAVLMRLRELGARYPASTALLLQPVVPATDGEADVAAARLLDATWNRAFLDPLLLGQYPALLMPQLAPFIADDDLGIIHQPVPFVGVNHYVRNIVAHDPARPLGICRRRADGTLPTSPFGMEIVPDAFLDVLDDLRTNYGNPCVAVTEFGYADTSDIPVPQLLADGGRIDYLSAMLAVLDRAERAGTPVIGVFPWTLLDNFEWEFGYWPRFGLVHVDRQTQERTPKASFQWYRATIAHHRRSEKETSL